MKVSKQNHRKSFPLISKTTFWFLVAGWTISICLSLGWNLFQLHLDITNRAYLSAKTAFNKDLLYRSWAAMHGGVYVPVTEGTPVNPYLDVTERDITTPSGRLLTLMNPAYMTRQVLRLGEEKYYGLHSHLTSLNPINPVNAPDSWEKVALHAFEAGEEEMKDIVKVDGEDRLRYMRPLVVEEGCLKCHEQHGYKEGDICGGLSVTVSLTPFQDQAKEFMAPLFFGHGLIWFLGLAGLMVAERRQRKSMFMLQESEKKLRQTSVMMKQEHNMFITGPVVVFKWKNQEGWPVEYVSANVKEIMEYSVEELLSGKVSYRELLHKEDLDRVANEVKTHNVNGVERFTHLPYRIIKKDGKSIWVVDYTTIIRDQAGKITHYLGYIVDITLRKQAEEALAKSEERFRELADLLPQPVFELNLEGNFTYSNQCGFETFGYTEEDLEMGFNALKLFIQEDRERIRDNIQKRLAGVEFTDHEYTGLREDGSPFPILIYSSSIIRNNKPVGVRGIVLDITEIKQLQEQLIRSERLAATGQLAASVAHEINSPLQGIIALLHYIKKRCPQELEVREDFQLVAEACNSIRDTVKHLLDLSRPGKEKKQPICINDLLTNTVSLLRNYLKKNKIRADLDLDPGMGDIMASPQQLGQVFINLLNNSVESMAGQIAGKGRRRRTIIGGEIIITTEQQDEWVVVKVANNGPAIEEDALDRVFDLFYTGKKKMGMGIGLALCQSIIEAHKGTITVQNRAKGGVVFTITLPRREKSGKQQDFHG